MAHSRKWYDNVTAKLDAEIESLCHEIRSTISEIEVTKNKLLHALNIQPEYTPAHEEVTEDSSDTLRERDVLSNLLEKYVPKHVTWYELRKDNILHTIVPCTVTNQGTVVSLVDTVFQQGDRLSCVLHDAYWQEQYSALVRVERFVVDDVTQWPVNSNLYLTDMNAMVEKCVDSLLALFR